MISVRGRALVDPGLVAVLLAATSYAVATGRPALRHNADSLIPVFVSLERPGTWWTVSAKDTRSCF